MKLGDTGKDVRLFQNRLVKLGYLERASSVFDKEVEKAVIKFQKNNNIRPDGVAGTITHSTITLEIEKTKKSYKAPQKYRVTVNTSQIAGVFPHADEEMIHKNWPFVRAGLSKNGLCDLDMVRILFSIMAMDAPHFAPATEMITPVNTDPGKHPYNRYDFRDDLGNMGRGDGNRFKGRGFIFLRGRRNYDRMSHITGVNLIRTPELAVDLKIASELAARILKQREFQIREAATIEDFDEICRLIGYAPESANPMRMFYKTCVNLVV